MSVNTTLCDENLLELDFNFPANSTLGFNHQNPTGFTHNLMNMEFLHFDSLLALADRYDNSPEDYFITSGAPSADAQFYSTGRYRCRPREALERLSTEPFRVLLKRPEKFDCNFNKLLKRIHAALLKIENGPAAGTLVRSETAVLISSAATITPFHFDPEFGFFSQIEGTKHYHVYSPAAVTEQELERFFVRGVIDIGKLDLANRDPRHEYVFALKPGAGFYQPHNAPHWVQTMETRSISYTFVFQTQKAAALSRVRAFNHYARKAGFSPSKPGVNPARDAMKAGVMHAVTPARRVLHRAGLALHQ